MTATAQRSFAFRLARNFIAVVAVTAIFGFKAAADRAPSSTPGLIAFSNHG